MKRIFKKLGLLNNKEKEKETKKTSKSHEKDIKVNSGSVKLKGIDFNHKEAKLNGSFFSEKK